MKKALAKSPGQILKVSLERLQLQNPRFSVRSAAKKIGVSAPFLSNVLKDHAPVPEKRFDAFASVFQLDDITQGKLREAMLVALVNKKRGSDQTLKRMLRANRPDPIESEDFYLYPEKQYDLLKHWYYFAILDLTTCENFQENPKWISTALGLSEAEVHSAIHFLVENKFLLAEGGRLRKAHNKIRLSTKRSMQVVRDYHAQLLNKGLWNLKNKISDVDFSERLISGVTFSVDPIHLEEAKQILNKALYEISSLAEKGNCTRVYQISGLLFPLSK